MWLIVFKNRWALCLEADVILSASSISCSHVNEAASSADSFISLLSFAAAQLIQKRLRKFSL